MLIITKGRRRSRRFKTCYSSYIKIKKIIKYPLHPITHKNSTINHITYHTPHYTWSSFTSNKYLPLYINTKTKLLNQPIAKFNNMLNSYLFSNPSHSSSFPPTGKNTIIRIKHKIFMKTKLPWLINKKLTHTASSRTSEQDSRWKMQISKTLKIIVNQPTFQKHTLPQTPLPPILPPTPSNITNKTLYTINKLRENKNTTKPPATNINT